LPRGAIGWKDLADGYRSVPALAAVKGSLARTGDVGGKSRTDAEELRVAFASEAWQYKAAARVTLLRIVLTDAGRVVVGPSAELIVTIKVVRARRFAGIRGDTLAEAVVHHLTDKTVCAFGNKDFTKCNSAVTAGG
jgi:hypothetical protein